MLSPFEDLILLDEPTNHVDLETVEFMEHLLRQQDVAMVVVSHDRYFLNHVCNLSMNGCCIVFVGPRGLVISNNLADILEKRSTAHEFRNTRHWSSCSHGCFYCFFHYFGAAKVWNQQGQAEDTWGFSDFQPPFMVCTGVYAQCLDFGQDIW